MSDTRFFGQEAVTFESSCTWKFANNEIITVYI